MEWFLQQKTVIPAGLFCAAIALRILLATKAEARLRSTKLR
ncbi:hypothetical protein BIWAKO_06109 [Bosea sp. BIWAKO-01]|nr:hypothetical protein BIWAKO_06109 [Bosea sp. BIWAKO-01]